MSHDGDGENSSSAKSRLDWNALAGWLFIVWVAFVTSSYLYFMLRSFVGS